MDFFTDFVSVTCQFMRRSASDWTCVEAVPQLVSQEFRHRRVVQRTPDACGRQGPRRRSGDKAQEPKETSGDEPTVELDLGDEPTVELELGDDLNKGSTSYCPTDDNVTRASPS